METYTPDVEFNRDEVCEALKYVQKKKKTVKKITIGKTDIDAFEQHWEQLPQIKRIIEGARNNNLFGEITMFGHPLEYIEGGQFTLHYE